MKEQYETPEMEIEVFDTEDVICSSNPEVIQGGDED